MKEVCSAHWIVSNHIPCWFNPDTLMWHLLVITFHVDFILRHFSDTFLWVAQIWTEEARVLQRVAYGFSSLKMVFEICLSLRALEHGKSWTAIIMDTRNEEDSYPLSCLTEYWCFDWVCDWGLNLMSSFYADCHFFGKNTRSHTNFHGNCFKGLTLRFDSHHTTFNDSFASRCSLSQLHSLKWLSFHG